MRLFLLYLNLQVELPDLGKLTKLRIWHEKRSPFTGWHLSKVSVLRSKVKTPVTSVYLGITEGTRF